MIVLDYLAREPVKWVFKARSLERPSFVRKCASRFTLAIEPT